MSRAKRENSPRKVYEVRHQSTTPHLQLWGSYLYADMAARVAERCNADETLRQFKPFIVREVTP